MTVTIHSGTHVPLDEQPGKDRWTFEATLNGQHGLVEFSAPSGTGYEQASGFAREILGRYPERLQGVTSVRHGVHDVFRILSPDGT